LPLTARKLEKVEERHDQDPGHEEVIVPVKAPQAPASPAPVLEGRAPRASRLPLIAVGLLLLTLAGGVFFVLPNWVAEQSPSPEVRAELEPPIPNAPEAPALSPEELAALQQQAESLLAELLTQQARLEAFSASEWGAGAWTEYRESSRAGDDAYLANAFHDAVPAYSRALELGAQLLERSTTIVDAALEAGRAALEAGNAAVAAEQYGLVLAIDAENSVAREGLARAEKLPEVLALVRQAQDAQRAGELEQAAQHYREALAIDAAWLPASSALADVEEMLRDRGFEAQMSHGLAALAAEDYDRAHEFFNAALVIRPGATEALDGSLQAEQGQRLDQIALIEARALAFERRELWSQAIEQYERALETDTTLIFAQQGLTRTRARADLDTKLGHLLANPNLLFDDGVLADSRELLAEARAIEERGQRLTGQIEELGRLVTLASTPVTVELRSDQMTDVMLYRIGELGAFAVTTVELRPGTYTAVGSRNGYRDVRETFTVYPGRELAPIRVQCVEPI
jgi:tetratricopeptide (TPR) repeat protein